MVQVVFGEYVLDVMSLANKYGVMDEGQLVSGQVRCPYSSAIGSSCSSLQALASGRLGQLVHVDTPLQAHCLIVATIETAALMYRTVKCIAFALGYQHSGGLW